MEADFAAMRFLNLGPMINVTKAAEMAIIRYKIIFMNSSIPNRLAKNAWNDGMTATVSSVPVTPRL